MSHHPRRLAQTMIAASALAALTAPLRAQQPPGADSVANDALADVRAESLRPGSWTYSATVTRDGATVELARRTLTIAPETAGGVAAWLILDETRARGQTMRDSLLVRRSDLRPLRRAAEMGPMRMALRFDADSAVGTMRVPGEAELRVVAASDGRTLVVNGGMLEAALRLLPLAAGWTGSIAQLVPGPTGATVVPVTLAVTGEEPVTVPAGRFDAWVVTATAAGAAQTFWVAKEGGVLVRHRASPPHAADVSYETVLVEAPGATPAMPPAAPPVPPPVPPPVR